MASTLDTAMFGPRSLRGLTNQIVDVRRHADRLRKLNDGGLLSAACGLRESFARAETSLATVSEGLGLSVEALRRTVGVELYDVQLMASFATSLGNVAEMQTGEGKTFSVAPAAILSALRGDAVHVATPNAYLAERDYALLSPVFEVLGISAGLTGDSNATLDSKKAAYNCEVTYATGFDLGFDYLRDQAAKQTTTHSPLGVELLKQLRGATMSGRTTIQRGHPMAIVDEIDHVLLDDAGSPLILCDAPDGNAEDAEACQLACRLVQGLVKGEHFHLNMTGTVSLTESGSQRIHDPEVAIPVKKLLRPWSEYVQQAIRARFCFHRDEQYVCAEKQIQIVDGSTGRIFSDRTWSEGLHQAIEAKERLPISSERSIVAQVTRQRYFRNYRRLAGMTGTAVGCEAEFRKIYNLKIWEIPRRLPCQRKLYPPRAFANVEAKYMAIAEETCAVHRTGRPILIGTRTIIESELMAALLRQRRVPFQLLNGRQDAQEAAVIAEAGKKYAITIATNMAGRGTDIRLHRDVKSLGGLHVIVAAPNELQRVDRQHASAEELARTETQRRIAEAQVLAMQEELELKSAEYARTEAMLLEKQIRSPIDGIVTHIYKDVGEFISASSPVVIKVVKLDVLLVQFAVPAKAAFEFEAGRTVTLSIGSEQTKAVGVIEFVSPIKDPQSNTVRLRLRIDNAGGQFSSGDTCFLALTSSGDDQKPVSPGYLTKAKPDLESKDPRQK